MLRLLSFCFAMLLFGAVHAQTPVVVYEFFNANLKQYFRTASEAEAKGIDAGAAGAGWSRTGDDFALWQVGQSGNGLVEVCRFYGSVKPGPNSHFFTASADECSSLKTLQTQVAATLPRWNYEGVAFMAKLPASGACAVGSIPIYRSYNQGAVRGIDSNHRLTSKKTEYDQTNASGWAGEGVVMCGCDPAANAACVAPATSATGQTSVKRLMDAVITPKCAGCHNGNSPMGIQSGLVLDNANIFKTLLNKTVKNEDARKHGIVMIKPREAGESFFYTKLRQWDPAESHQFGAPMPLGSQSLSVGQLEFIKRWINEGASDTTDNIPAALLADTSVPSYGPFTALAPPANGFQLSVSAFSVQPNFEREIFVYQKLTNPQPLYINRFETRMRTNSHHFVMYVFDPNTPSFVLPTPNTIRDLREPNGNLNLNTAFAMGYHIYFAGATTPNSVYTFPPGVALEVPANMGVDLNLHYVNKSGSPIQGEAYANFEAIDRSKVTHVARTLNLNNTNITLPANQRTTLSKTFTFSEGRNVVMLTSHTHKYGEKFLIRISGGPRNGQLIYESDDWEHPIAKTFDPPLVLAPGEGLTSEITYFNSTANTIRFGLTSEDEMGIIFGYYY